MVERAFPCRHDAQPLPRDSRGQTHEREVKLHLFRTVWHDVSKITMDWRGRATDREVKLHILADTSNLSQGLAWSNARTQGKVASFSDRLA